MKEKLDGDLKICKLMAKEIIGKNEIYEVNSIEQCFVTNGGLIHLLTGDFAGECISSFDDPYVEDGMLCAWVEDIEDAQKYFPTNNMDDLRDRIAEVMCFSKYARNPITNQLYPINVYENYDEEENEPIQVKTKTKKKKELALDQIENKIRKDIIGQDTAVRKVLTTIYTNKRVLDSSLTKEQKNKLKNNILLVGKSGTGKTEILRQVAKYVDMPIVIEDATKYTVEGYVGGCVSDMLVHLYNAADKNLAKAQRGILVIDEIDKKRSGSETGFVGGEGVQNSLLKIIEGQVFNLEQYYDIIPFDTSNLTIVFTGAFSGMYEKEEKSKSLGFGNISKNDESISRKIYEPEDFIKFGMIPEIMGRISTIIQLNDFTLEDYKNIIKKSNISPIYLKRLFYKSQNIKLNVEEQFIEEVARKAMKLNIGARGIKTVLDQIFEDLDFDVLNNEIDKIKLTKSGVVRVLKPNVKNK